MTYSVVCPYPCRYEIRIDAMNNEDAVMKFLTAGALSCRNNDHQCNCEKVQNNTSPPTSPIAEEKLKHIVSTCIREEQKNLQDKTNMLVPFYG